MNALIVFAHPESRSFNGALRTVAADALSRLGHHVEISDLYAEGFDPLEGPAHYECRNDATVFSPLGEQRHAFRNDTIAPDVRREIARLERADLVILQFPLWWHAQPAMLKGWFDRVFLSGGLYTSTMRYDRGYFQGRRALLSVTSGAPETAFGRGSRGGDVDTMLWPIHYSLHYVGFTVLPPFLAHGVQGHGYAYSSANEFAERLEAHKRRLESRIENLASDVPLRFPGWKDWDDDGAPRGRLAARGRSLEVT